jgi:hypothetical protein
MTHGEQTHVVIWWEQVMLALYSGVFWGCFIIYKYSLVNAFKNSLSVFLLDAIADPDHVYVIIFSWLLAGMVRPSLVAICNCIPVHSIYCMMWTSRHNIQDLLPHRSHCKAHVWGETLRIAGNK